MSHTSLRAPAGHSRHARHRYWRSGQEAGVSRLWRAWRLLEQGLTSHLLLLHIDGEFVNVSALSLLCSSKSLEIMHA